MLNRTERIALLRLARKSLAHFLANHSPLADEQINDLAQGEIFSRVGNCFVTLHSVGHLRGCVGIVRGDTSLRRAVAMSAVSAGTSDSRFPPLQPSELDECEIEISVLGEFIRVGSNDEIVVGRDGLLVEADGYRGLLLPQVAQRFHWTAEEFVHQVAVKAGIPGGKIPPEARLFRFEAEVFGEEEFPELSHQS